MRQRRFDVPFGFQRHRNRLLGQAKSFWRFKILSNNTFYRNGQKKKTETKYGCWLSHSQPQIELKLAEKIINCLVATYVNHPANSQHINRLSNVRTMIKNSISQSSRGNSSFAKISSSWTIWHWIYQRNNGVHYNSQNPFSRDLTQKLVNVFLDLFACLSEEENPLCRLTCVADKESLLKRTAIQQLY